jgi:PPOX class probable FMN-dependent enzyme
MPDTPIKISIKDASRVTSVERLSEIYEKPNERVIIIETPELDASARTFIELSPLVLVGTEGSVASKGDEPGFVSIFDDKTLLIPDRAGNNRQDTNLRVLKNPAVGLLFVIPGINHVLRVNGKAEITDDSALLEPMSMKGKAPVTALIIHVEQVYYNCARSLLRSKLWDADAQLDSRAVASPAEIVAVRLKIDPAKTNANYEQRMTNLYAND